MKRMKRVLAALLCSALMLTTFVPVLGQSNSLAAAQRQADSLTVTELKVNNLVSPLGIDTAPTFRWLNQSDGYGKSQSHYQVIVSSTPEKAAAKEGDIWDSGKAAGANNYDIVYGGSPLSSRTPYYWSVRVWDEKDEASAWSDVEMFETGVLNQGEWTGQWIGAVKSVDMNLQGACWIWSRYGKEHNQVPAETMYFRSKFTVDPDKTVTNVYLGMSTDDYGKVYVNGGQAAEVANANEAWRSGTLKDITAFVKPGENIVAADVTNGSAGDAGFICKIEVLYSDNTSDTIVTDKNWKLTKSPQAGWKEAAFDDSSWETPDQDYLYGSGAWGSNVSLKTLSEETSAPMLRKTFDVTQEVVKARAYVCGLGLFEMKINSQLPDDSVLNPAHTQYEDTVHYRVFDVTGLLQDGKNAISVELGNSFFNNTVSVWNWQNAVWRDNPKLLMELWIEYADGSTEKIGTDQSWKCYKEGSVVVNDILQGDRYDARREVPGWEQAGFDDTGWQDASLMKAPAGKLTFESMEPMRRLAAYVPEVTDMGEGTYIIKNPVMATGWAKIALDAPAGTELTITYGETLLSSGYLKKPTDFGVNFQIDKYICKGEPGETYEPKFSYKGYQYIQVENYPGDLKPEDVSCYLIANDVADISKFETSSSMINALHESMNRTIRNNMQGKPTDTPIWEKNGWLGDFNVSLESINYNFDTTSFTTKFIGDMVDSADGRGVVPTMTPNAEWGGGNTVVWNGALINAVYEGARTFGLNSVAQTYYDDMRRQALAYIDDIRGNGWVWTDGQMGDWVGPSGGTDPNAGTAANASEGSGICGTGYVYDLLSRIAEMADQFGKPDDAAQYRSAMSNIYTAFNEKFYNAEKGYYETTVWDGNNARTRYRQTSNLVPLAFGLCPDEYRDRVVNSLLVDIESKNYHLDTGMVGTKLLLPVLSQTGNTDIAYKILLQDTYPSWGYWLTSTGTNSTWEGYENSARSHSHYFLGTYDEWFYKYIAGIRDMTDGYKTVAIAPEASGNLTYADCSLDTVRGPLKSGWRFTDGDTLTMEITVPVGTTATVTLPADSPEDVTVNGGTLDGQAGITSAAGEDGKVRLTAGSGSYTFVMDSNVVPVSKNGLQKALKDTEDLEELHYYESAWNTFDQVVKRAEAMLADETATQSAVNAMERELRQAIDALLEQIDQPRKELGDTIALTDSLNRENYPPARWEALFSAIETAKERVADRTLGAEELAAAQSALLSAMEKAASYRTGNMALNGKVTASSTVNNSEGAGWHVNNLTDGDRYNQNGRENCGWTSNNDLANDHEEWVEIDLGSPSKFDTVQLMPGGYFPDTKCDTFPKDFAIEVSSDGENWATALTVKDYPVPEPEMQSFSFDPVYARYVRVHATSLRPKASEENKYRMQLAEVEVYRSQRVADVKTAPAKTEYLAGEYFDPAGLQIEIGGSSFENRNTVYAHGDSLAPYDIQAETAPRVTAVAYQPSLETALPEGTQFIAIDLTLSYADGAEVKTEEHHVMIPVTVEKECAHSFGEWIQKEDVHHQRTCSKCGAVQTEEHEFGPSENTDGHTHRFTCTKCGYEKTGEHAYGGWTDSGDAGHERACTVCGNAETKPHTAGDWIIDKEATGTEPGKKHKECVDCGRVVETAGIPVKEFSVTVNGGSGDGSYKAGETVKITADSPTENGHFSCWKVISGTGVTLADSTKAVATFTMVEGPVVLEAVFEKHVPDGGWQSDAANHWHICGCGIKIDQQAHTFRWVVDRQATATEKGSKHQECTDCGYQRPAVEIPQNSSSSSQGSSGNTKTGDTGNPLLMVLVLLLAAACYPCVRGSWRNKKQDRN